MGEQVLHKITIDGTDVTNYVTAYTIVDTVEDITPAKIVFIQDILNILNLDIQQEVVISRGFTTSTDYIIFRGYVSSVNKNYGTTIQVECYDKLWLLKRKILSTSYDINIDTEAGVISAIAQDLIETYGGLTADVENSGVINTINKFILRNNSLYEKLKELAKYVDYDLYYDPITDKINFKSRGYASFATELSVGTNLVEIPIWEYDYSKIINDVTITGGLQEVETTDDSQTGDGLTTDFVLDFKPESVKVFVNNVLQIGGIEGQTETYDYSVDKETNTISFVSPPAVLGLEFRYSYLVPVTVRQRNNVSIAKYGVYQSEKKIDTLVNTEDVIIKADEIISKFAEPIVNSSLRVINTLGIQAGYKVTVNDYIQNESREVIVRRITYSYPVAIDEIDVDDAPLYTDYFLKNEIVRRLRELEKKSQSTNTLITQIMALTRTFKPRRRYFEVTDEKVADSFIVGHYVNGLVGMGTLLDDFEAGTDVDWTESAGIIDTDDVGTVLVGSGSLKVEFTDTGSQTLTTTQSFGNLSVYTGQTSGTPSQGTVGLWWNSPNTTGITAITLRIGSSATDYIECLGREYRTVNGYNNFGNLTFDLFSGWNYFLFDLDNPDSTSGTADWTAIDYARIEFTVASTHTGYLDYMTMSRSNYIGANGVGSRVIDLRTVKLVQGNMIYREHCYDTKFHDSVNSTATFSTVTNNISFTAGQIWYSDVIDLGTTLSYITVTLGTTVGTILIEISSDNKVTWQTVTNSTRIAVSSSDGLGTYIRLTENAAGVATINLTTDSTGQVTSPVIKATLEE